ncbi:MAG: diguanylate cyclase [Gammaproteobacteria bacterium]|nr:MAG: diguanylate cyclase [Gammaproteobacteria bacterium]
MNLQSKVLLILTSLWVVICVVIYIDSKVTLESDYKKIEQQLALKDMHRVQKAIDNKLAALQLYTNSWSEWDDSYDFIGGANNNFIASNFVPGTFTSSHINFFLLFATNGKFFAGRAFDLNKKEFIPIPPDLTTYLETHPSFVVHQTANSPRVGILKIQQGSVVMSSLPILTSDGKGPIHGSLLMGYFLTDEFFKTIAETVEMKINFFPLPLTRSDSLLETAYQKLTSGSSSYVTSKNTTTSYGFILLKDINNEAVGLLKIEIPQEVYNAGVITIYHFLAIVIVLGVIILITMMFLLKALVLNRITHAIQQVIAINSQSDFHKRLITSGHDELTKMITTINSMLEVIELSQEQLKYRISRRTKDLERLSQLNRNLFQEMGKQKSIEEKLREDEKLLRQIAYYDALTELPNRTFFNELLQQELSNAERHQQKLAVLFVDVDKFKKINDTYGRDIGDKFLKQVALRLKEAVQDRDIISRLSGDEFILCLTNVSDRKALEIRIATIFQSLSYPIQIEDITLEPHYSIGVSLYPDDARTAEELINDADLAMYYAKKQEGNTYRYYDAIENLRSLTPIL